MQLKWKLIKRSICDPEMSHVLFLILQMVPMSSAEQQNCFKRHSVVCFYNSRQWLGF